MGEGGYADGGVPHGAVHGCSSSVCTDPQAYAASLMSAWGVTGIVPSISVSVQSGSTCNSTAGHFSAVAISGTGSGLGALIAPLSATVLTASACYPSST